ncbi:hypothetical protein QTP70_031215 [Hemibagrus guttatus]|uniref:Uncharacterized protein n=1 Tax=Hemibagrus guttatus TaxID=175788 RepID=A0AAE0UI52_9TELE|nr:hypothetical protein QTP70_031215 [Hemibagrus guttatus]
MAAPGGGGASKRLVQYVVVRSGFNTRLVVAVRSGYNAGVSRRYRRHPRELQRPGHAGIPVRPGQHAQSGAAGSR